MSNLLSLCLVLNEVYKSFLLIDRTGRIITLSSSAGYLRLFQHLAKFYNYNVLIVIADIDEGLSQWAMRITAHHSQP